MVGLESRSSTKCAAAFMVVVFVFCLVVVLFGFARRRRAALWLSAAVLLFSLFGRGAAAGDARRSGSYLVRFGDDDNSIASSQSLEELSSAA